MKTENITSVKILRHIADLHEAGIIADDAKTNEECEEWHKHGFYWGGNFTKQDGMHFEYARRI